MIKLLDKGLLERLGPFGVYLSFRKMAKFLEKSVSPYIFFYIYLFFFSMFLFIIFIILLNYVSLNILLNNMFLLLVFL